MLKLALYLTRHSFVSLLLVVCTLSIPTPHGFDPPRPPAPPTTTTTPTTTDELLIPPTITSEPKRLYYCEKQPHETIVLTCTATGNPVPVVTWHRIGGSLPDKSDDGRGNLNLTAANSDGYYQCLAQNTAGIASSNITQLLCLTDDPKWAEQQPVVVADTAVLRCCQDVDRYPVTSLKIRWIRKNTCDIHDYSERRNEETITNSQKSHVADNDNNTLVLTDLQQNDLQCYTFTCEITFHTARNNGVHRPTTDYRITALSDGANNERRLVYRSEPITAVEGHDVTMTCVYSGRTPANVTWSRLSGQPVRGHVTEFSRQLRLQSVQQEDSDTYSCTTVDSSDTKNTIQLTVDAKPTIVAPLRSVNVTVGATISLSFKVSGRPRPEVTCRVNKLPPFTVIGQLPFCKSTKAQTQSNENETEINITCNEVISGFVIACNASNIHDYQMSSAYVAVRPLNYIPPTTGTTSPPPGHVTDSPTESHQTGSLSMTLISVPVGVTALIALVVVVVVVVMCAKKRRSPARNEVKKQEKQEAAAPPPQLDNQSMHSNSRQSLSTASSISASSRSIDSGIEEVNNSVENKINEELQLMGEHRQAQDADSNTDDDS